MVVLEQSAIEAILAVQKQHTKTGFRNYCMLVLLARYGLKPGELLSLTTDAVDISERTISITKRTILLFEEDTIVLRDYIREHQPSTYLFSTHQGTKIGARYLQTMVANATEDAGINKQVIPSTFYDSYVVRRINETGNAFQVAREMGILRMNNLQRHIDYTRQKDQ